MIAARTRPGLLRQKASTVQPPMDWATTANSSTPNSTRTASRSGTKASVHGSGSGPVGLVVEGAAPPLDYRHRDPPARPLGTVTPRVPRPTAADKERASVNGPSV